MKYFCKDLVVFPLTFESFASYKSALSLAQGSKLERPKSNVKFVLMEGRLNFNGGCFSSAMHMVYNKWRVLQCHLLACGSP